ncbi:MAG: hypothetical protein ACI84D_003320, partial [Thalassolituus oleivorans]
MKQGINLWLLILVVATLPACELVSSGTSNEPGHQQGLVLPEATGAYTVGTASFVVVDADRDDEYTPEVDSRELNVKLWYPADQEGQGTVSYMNALV